MGRREEESVRESPVQKREQRLSPMSSHKARKDFFQVEAWVNSSDIALLFCALSLTLPCSSAFSLSHTRVHAHRESHYKLPRITESLTHHKDEDRAHQNFAAVWFPVMSYLVQQNEATVDI